MKFYQELTLLPDVESSPYFLWSKVYTQIHIAFAHAKNEYQLTGFGVSFPQYRFEKQGNKTWATLGVKLRVFAQSEDELNQLNLAKWLERLTDYVHLKSIAEVGNKPTHQVVVERYRCMSLAKQAERFANLKNISFEDALKHCQTHKRQPENYPFIELFSQTNQIPYRLHVKQTLVDSPVNGNFTVYGMHNQGGDVAGKATVPHW